MERMHKHLLVATLPFAFGLATGLTAGGGVGQLATRSIVGVVVLLALSALLVVGAAQRMEVDHSE